MAVGVSPAHTSVPRDGALRLDVTGREHLVVAEDEGALAELDRALAAATVGVRVYVSGTEPFVRAAQARCRAAGLLDEEVATEVRGAAGRSVRCVHCTTTTTTEAVVGDEVRCAGCGVPLLVYHHFSRRHGAYMGFRADAEDPRA